MTTEVVTYATSLAGQRIGYSSETMFFVQVGRYDKGHYRNRYAIKGNLREALQLYACINIGNGYKKRLCMEEVVLARAKS